MATQALIDGGYVQDANIIEEATWSDGYCIKDRANEEALAGYLLDKLMPQGDGNSAYTRFFILLESEEISYDEKGGYCRFIM